MAEEAKEAWQELRAFQVKALHEGCTGEFVFNGLSRPMIPPQYQHNCTKCKAQAWYREHYPLVKYKEVDGG